MDRRRLTVVAVGDEYMVVYADDRQDWVARFHRRWPEAHDWAQNMADLYNRRADAAQRGEDQRGHSGR